MTSLPHERAMVLISSSSWADRARRVRGFRHPMRWAGKRVDMTIGDGAGSGDEVFAGVPWRTNLRSVRRTCVAVLGMA
jgi:hypothetical protein